VKGLIAAPFILLLMTSAAIAQSTVADWNAIGITAARATTAPGSATAGGPESLWRMCIWPSTTR
jgi:hypothetical protein